MIRLPLVLIFTAFVILVRRGLNWGGVMGRNKALLLIYLFFAVSCCWSDSDFSSLKPSKALSFSLKPTTTTLSTIGMRGTSSCIGERSRTIQYRVGWEG